MSSHSQQRVEGPLSPPTRGHIGEIHSTTEELIEVMSQLASTLLYVSSKLLSNQTTSPLAGFIDYYRHLCEQDGELESGTPIQQKSSLAIQHWSDAMDAIKTVDARRFLTAMSRFLRLYTEISESQHAQVATIIFRAISEQTIKFASPKLLARLSQLLRSICAEKPSDDALQQAAYARLEVFAMTNGSYNEFINDLIGIMKPARPHVAQPGVLELEHPSNLIRFRRNMARDGYSSFGKVLTEQACDALLEFSRACPGTPCGLDGKYGSETTLSELHEPVSGFRCNANNLLEHPIIQNLLADPSFEEAARQYLRCEPVFVDVGLWWSFPTQDSINAQAEMAQFMHWDGDWNKWIKFFIHITDVDFDCGPHVFIKGSHQVNTKPQDLLDRGYVRIADHELASVYGEESFVAVTAPRGTVVAGDTKCWHRGTKPEARPRLMAQIQFADTFETGGPVKPFTLKTIHNPEFLHRIELNRNIYSRIITKKI